MEILYLFGDETAKENGASVESGRAGVSRGKDRDQNKRIYELGLDFNDAHFVHPATGDVEKSPWCCHHMTNHSAA